MNSELFKKLLAPFYVMKVWSLRTGFYLADKECREEGDQWAQPTIEFEEHGVQTIMEAAKVKRLLHIALICVGTHTL